MATTSKKPKRKIATKGEMNGLEQAKREVHQLVDQLPVSELHAAKQYLKFLRDEGDPVLKAFLNAPEDDEPETEEERQAVEEARSDIRAGRVYSHEEVKRRLFGHK